ASWMAICVRAVVGVAPCQCFSLGANQTTSPVRISSIGPPSRCARPQPAVTISVCPNGCVCQAVRAPGSNVTLAPRTRAGSGASNSGSMRTVPVKYSAGPLLELCEPDLFISIFQTSSLREFLSTLACHAVVLTKEELSTINFLLTGTLLLPDSGTRVFQRMNTRNDSANLGGTFTLPGTSITLNRIGYGAMQLAGPHVFGPPADHDGALAVLREVVKFAIDHIDTSDFYGPHVTNQLIKEELHPYPEQLRIVTK